MLQAALHFSSIEYVKDIMQAQDKKLCNKARALSHHPLNEILPKPKPQQYN